jgi:hypothetical protein
VRCSGTASPFARRPEPPKNTPATAEAAASAIHANVIANRTTITPCSIVTPPTDTTAIISRVA